MSVDTKGNWYESQLLHSPWVFCTLTTSVAPYWLSASYERLFLNILRILFRASNCTNHHCCAIPFTHNVININERHIILRRGNNHRRWRFDLLRRWWVSPCFSPPPLPSGQHPPPVAVFPPVLPHPVPPYVYRIPTMCGQLCVPYSYIVDTIYADYQLVNTWTAVYILSVGIVNDGLSLFYLFNPFQFVRLRLVWSTLV